MIIIMNISPTNVIILSIIALILVLYFETSHEDMTMMSIAPNESNIEQQSGHSFREPIEWKPPKIYYTTTANIVMPEIIVTSDGIKASLGPMEMSGSGSFIDYESSPSDVVLDSQPWIIA